jgi:hypothetical protein
LSIDWKRGTAELRIRRDLVPQQRLNPSLRTEFLRQIRQVLPQAFLETAGPVAIDSRSTFSSRFSADPEFTKRVTEAVRSADRTRTYFSGQMSSFTAVYRLPLYPDLVDPLIRHDRAHRPQPLLEYVPTGSYSGIVIYVEEERPLYGTDRSAGFRPSLFPRIFGPELEPLINKSMVKPETLRRWGMAAFFDYGELGQLSSRVGDVPFYTSAEAIFGNNRTDIILSRRAARRLQASDHMYRLVKEGKIAVICALPTR